KGTLQELSFFGHGWQGGPILVNSFDPTKSDPTQPRNADDKDARQFKDFIAPTMDTTQLANFRAAFASPAIVWICGSSFVRAAHIVLGRLFHSAKFRSTPAGTLKDTDSFTLDFSVDTPTPTVTDLNTIKDSILPGGTLKGNDYTVTLSFLDIKNAFRTLI